VQADKLLQGTSDEEAKAVQHALGESEKRIGREAGQVRKNLDAMLAESLTLKIAAAAAQK
jgi:hypothetical protein